MDRETIPVALGERGYEVRVGRGLLSDLRGFLGALAPSSLLLVTDAQVDALHGARVEAALADVAPVRRMVAPVGEASKSLGQLSRLYDLALAEPAADRACCVVALGGGVVGDLAGLFAATLLRGVPCVQVPTSLLAMVDSSVGGKTAVNHSEGKNLIGLFSQPRAVFCDLEFLETLPGRELRSALAEVLKTVLLDAPEATESLLAAPPAGLLASTDGLRDRIASCIRYKASVVMRDETETGGERAVLNLGHTVAHVLETRFPGRYLHGEAVAVGLAAALARSVRLHGLDSALRRRAVAWLEAVGLPVTAPEELTAEALWQGMGSDKKREGAEVVFVGLRAPGDPVRERVALTRQLAEELLEGLHGRA